MTSIIDFSFLNNEHIPEIERLRNLAFLNFYKSAVEPSGLIWNSIDKASMHLGFFINKKHLVSYLRLTFFTNNEMLEKATRIKTPEKFKTPVALLARAATDPSYLSCGLHSGLRSIALQTCLRANINTVFGSLEEKSFRTKQLLAIGYEIVARAPRWNDSFIRSSHGYYCCGQSVCSPIWNADGAL